MFNPACRRCGAIKGSFFAKCELCAYCKSIHKPMPSGESRGLFKPDTPEHVQLIVFLAALILIIAAILLAILVD